MDGRIPDPATRADEVADLAAEFENLKVADSERLQRYVTYRKENEAARSLQLDSMTRGDVDTDYGIRASDGSDPIARHTIPLPFGMALAVKHSYRVSGRLPDAIVDRREESEFERYRSDTMEKMWWGWLRGSGDSTLFADGAWDGSHLGATVIDAYWNPAAQMPLFQVSDPAGTIVVRGLDDPHDFQRVFRYWHVPLSTAKAEYRDKLVAGVGLGVDEMESTHKVGDVEMATLVECCTKQARIRFSCGGESGAGGSVELMRRVHGLGFVPKVVIPNLGPYRDVWGWADYEQVRALVSYLENLTGREADILKMVANGAYIEKGTHQDPEDIKHAMRVGGIIPSKQDGSIEPIAAPDVPTFQSEHAARIVEMIKMLGFAPDAAWGGSDTRSGSDRTLQLQPQLELTAMKQMNWSQGLSRLAAYGFRMVEKNQTLSTTYRGARLQGVNRVGYKPFVIGPEERPARQEFTDTETGAIAEVELPRKPEDLFQKDYSMRFQWQNRIDPDDPAYVLSELNKFQQGAQSLRTTLERLGVQSPEDEIKLIEEEAEKFPWLRQGMIALLRAQLAAAGDGSGGGGAGQGGEGGRPEDPLARLGSALGMTLGKDGAAMDADAGAAALPGSMPGQTYGGA